MAIYCLGVFLRLLPYANFITPDGVYFLEGDNYEHLRKILVILSDFPNAPAHDYYAGFPVGSGAIWAPLFDLSMAVLVKIAVFLGVGFEKASALIPPFAGMLVLAPVYLWGRRLFGERTAVFSVLILALLPAHISMTTVGRLDNELVEPLFAGLVFYFYQLSLDNNNKNLAIAAGIVMAVALLFWRGALIWWAVIALHGFLLVLADKSAAWARTALSFLAAAVLIAMVTVLGLWGTSATISFNTVGWFHVISALFVVALVSSARLGWFLKSARGFGSAVSICISVAAFGVAVAIVAVALPAYFGGILSGMGVVGGENPWTKTIAEYQPLFTGADGRFSLASPITISTAFIFIFPAVLLYLTVGYFRQRGEGAERPFFMLCGWALFALTAINGRYENVLTVLLAIGGAYFVAMLSGRARGLSGVAGVALTLVMLLPSYAFFRDVGYTEPFGIRGDMEESFKWLRDNTPETSNYLEPYKKPEYGVMARWEYGGWIEYVARRPSIATLFGIETHGLMESAEFFLETDAEKALALLGENGARYVVITNDTGALSGYAKLLGRDPAGYVEEMRDEGGVVRYGVGPKFLDLVFARLMLADGQYVGGPAYLQAVPGLRLVYESKTREDIAGALQEVKKVKIFERVPGAVVRGAARTARPGEVVTLAGSVVTNQGRIFTAISQARADERGAFELRGYYPTLAQGTGAGLASVEGEYALFVSGRRLGVSVTEDDVTSGAVIDTTGATGDAAGAAGFGKR